MMYTPEEGMHFHNTKWQCGSARLRGGALAGGHFSDSNIVAIVSSEVVWQKSLELTVTAAQIKHKH